MFLEYFTSMLVAALVGGLIGIEREYRDKSAGFRTMILIAVGSALFTLLSQLVGGGDGESTRIAAAVVSGVGFLGVGVIIKDGNTIHGLTTAASIWLVSSLGMAAGAQLYDVVAGVTILTLLVLWLLPPFERWIDRLHDFSEFWITVKNTQKAEEKILNIFADEGIQVVQIRRSRKVKGERILHIKANMNDRQHQEISLILAGEKSIIAFND